MLIGKAYAYAVNKTVYIDNDNHLAGQEATEYPYPQGTSAHRCRLGEVNITIWNGTTIEHAEQIHRLGNAELTRVMYQPHIRQHQQNQHDRGDRDRRE